MFAANETTRNSTMQEEPSNTNKKKTHIYVSINYVSSQPDTIKMKHMFELCLEVHCICHHRVATAS
jgi:hypothetical protein